MSGPSRRAVAYGATVSLALLAVVAADRLVKGGLPDGSLGWTVIQTASTCLMLVGLGGLFGRVAVFFHTALVLLLSCVVGAAAFSETHFPNDLDAIGSGWLMVLANSSCEEVAEFLRATMTTVDWLVVGFALLAFLVYLAVAWRLRPGHLSARSALMALIASLPFVVFNRPPHPYCDCLAMAAFDHHFRLNADSLSCSRDLSRVGQPTARPFSCQSDDLVGVFVIGESSTRHHWSLYGYGRKTTPRLDALREELVVFTNVTTDCWLTTPSLRSHLTDYVAGRSPATVSLPSAAVAAGFRATLFSGQNHWGHVDGADALLFRACQERTFLSDLAKGSAYYDDSLLPLVARELAVTNARKVVFVHLLGSHRTFSERYPREKTLFGTAEKPSAVDAYDNSIAFTDGLVAELIERLKGDARPSFLVFTSDHGEEPESENRTQGQSMRSIPLVVWLSPEYRRRFPGLVADLQSKAEAAVNSDLLFPIYSDLLRLTEKGGAGNAH